MLVIPAIDLIEGKCVRLYKGNYQKLLLSRDDPVTIARSFEEQGAEWLHIVDLEGAKEGKPRNMRVVEEIRKNTKLNIQFGGGIRSLKDIEMVLSIGVTRVILGTSALNEDFLGKVLNMFGSKIAVAVDSKEGKIAVEGWLKETEIDVERFAEELDKRGVECLIYTSIVRDGTLEGPNFEEIKKIRKTFGKELIASGGISSLYDLLKLKEIGVNSAIIGRALYEGKVDLSTAIKHLSSVSD